MKKIFITIALMCAMVCSANAQNYTKNGNTYQSVKTTSTRSSKEIKTEYVYADTKGNSYPIYMGSTGSCYIKRISKNTGKEYKQYLGEEISRDICKQMHLEYKGKSSADSTKTTTSNK